MTVEVWLWVACSALAATACVCAVGWRDARGAMEWYRQRAVQAEGELAVYRDLQAAVQRARDARRSAY